MAEQVTLTSGMPVRRAERLIRNQAARAGEIWVWASPAQCRKLRQLAARFTGWDAALFLPPPPDPGWHGRDPSAGAGGLLIVTAPPRAALR